MKRVAAILLIVFCLFSAAAAEGIGFDAVLDTSNDAGLFTMRFLWMGRQTEEDKPGDCIILTSPDGKVMVIDAGHDAAVHFALKALEQMGIKKIDYLIASHPHIDHIGGMPALMDRYEVGVHYSSELWYNTGTYRDYTEAIARNGVEQVYLHEGDSFMFGEHIKVEVLNPPEEIEYYDGYPEDSTKFMNNHSLALKFTYGESTALFSGDLYNTGERQVLERWGEALDVDVFKANHHGGTTSSSVKWRKAVSPLITVATSDNIEDTNLLLKFDQGEAEVYHTFMDGIVCVTTAGDGTYTVTTEKERATDIFDE